VIAVSDTSPLNYLVLIESVYILPALFERVIVPTSVALELAHENAPPKVHLWIETPPPWLEVQAAAPSDSSILLGAGERDAICLTKEIDADVLLIDDRAARRVARTRGVTVIGTLGLLELADAQGLLDLGSAMEALLRTSFRIRADVIHKLLDARSRRQERG
jgi:predicted nucleic acid-binding protein